MRSEPEVLTAAPDGDAARRADLARARAALERLLPEVVAVVRSLTRPDATAVGDWSSLDVARHLSHVSAGELFLARTIGQPLGPGFPIGDDLVAGASDFNAGNLATDTESDLDALATRIDANVSELLEVTGHARGDEDVAWLGGTVLPSSCLAAHLVGELVIHGYDMSRAEGRRWDMRSEEAALGFGFFLDVLRFCPVSMRPSFVTEDGAQLDACFDFRLRGGRRDFIVFENGGARVEAPSERAVDCRISADPSHAYLAGFGRVGIGRAAFGGRMLAWGRRPLLAFKLPGLIRNP